MHLLYVFLNSFESLSLETDFSYLISEQSLFKTGVETKEKYVELTKRKSNTTLHIYSNDVGVKIPNAHYQLNFPTYCIKSTPKTSPFVILLCVYNYNAR